METDSLVGRLQEISIGDELRLTTKDGNRVIGFVVKKRGSEVKLSHENPNNERSLFGYSYLLWCLFSKGDRWYCLRESKIMKSLPYIGDKSIFC